jgi:cell division protease FtsH
LVKEQHEKAKAILTENSNALNRLADYLYEKETITGDEFMKILHAVENGVEIAAFDEEA